MENEELGILESMRKEVSAKLALWTEGRITDLEVVEFVLHIDKLVSEYLATMINIDQSILGSLNFEYGKLLGAIIKKFGTRDVEDIHKALKRDDIIDNLLNE